MVFPWFFYGFSMVFPIFPGFFPSPDLQIAEALAQGRPGPRKRGAAQCGAGAGAAGVAGGFSRATVPWCWKSHNGGDFCWIFKVLL